MRAGAKVNHSRCQPLRRTEFKRRLSLEKLRLQPFKLRAERRKRLLERKNPSLDTRQLLLPSHILERQRGLHSDACAEVRYRAFQSVRGPLDHFGIGFRNAGSQLVQQFRIIVEEQFRDLFQELGIAADARESHLAVHSGANCGCAHDF